MLYSDIIYIYIPPSGIYAYFPFYHPFPMFLACIFLAACGHHLIHAANLRTSPSSIVKFNGDLMGF